MAGSIFRHIEGNRNKEEQRLIERDYGGDLINMEHDDYYNYDYDLEPYLEFNPTFSSWIESDERRELIKNITSDKKKIFLK